MSLPIVLGVAAVAGAVAYAAEYFDVRDKTRRDKQTDDVTAARDKKHAADIVSAKDEGRAEATRGSEAARLKALDSEVIALRASRRGND